MQRDCFIRVAVWLKPSFFRSAPERPCSAHFFERRDHFQSVLPAARHPVGVQALAKIAARKKLQHVVQREDSLFCAGLELRPGSNVLFRPEEIHCASRVWKVVSPLMEGDCHVSNDRFRLRSKNHSVTNFHDDGQPAIETRGIYADRFPGEKPADRQRFKPSLAEPLLLAVNGYPVLSGKVVKGCKGSNQAGVGEKPPGNP